MDHARAAELLALRHPLLLVYVRAIVGIRQPCEDIVQEAAVICLRKHEEIPDDEAFEGWIRRVCRFEALKYLERHRREHATAAEQLAILTEVELTAAAEEVAGDRVLALRHCLERLPAHTRTLVHMRYVEDCSGDEIAKRLGRPINTIYITMSRLHKSLGDCVRTRLGREGTAHGI